MWDVTLLWLWVVFRFPRVQCFFDSISRMQLLVDSSSVETYKVLQDEVAQLRVLAENGEIWMQLAKYKDSQDLKTTQELLNHITSLCYRCVGPRPFHASLLFDVLFTRSAVLRGNLVIRMCACSLCSLLLSECA